MQIDRDTIVAIATPRGRGAVGVVRLSGERVPELLKRHLRWRGGEEGGAPARTLRLATFVDGAGNPVDEVLAVHFPAPRSFTGEDVTEIHGHGSPVLMEAMVEALVASGVRIARPGEFTERAFLSGKIDLTQAEAIQELVSSRSLHAAALARRLLDGELGGRVRNLLDGVVEVEAQVEVGIDFVDEDIEPADTANLVLRHDHLLASIDSLLRGYRAARRVLEGLRVVLVGDVNAGKSSIFNALIGESRSIVTPEAGTTRDYVEVAVEWQGIAIHLVDTAGLRRAESMAEVEGINRSREEVGRADVLLRVVDSTQPVLGEELELPEVPTLTLWNKIDIGEPTPPAALVLPPPVHPVCALTGEGLDGVRDWIVARSGVTMGDGAESLACLPRHRDALQRARCALQSARAGVADGWSPELIAFELREARESLGEVVGERTSEELLDVIFSRFCIGK